MAWMGSDRIILLSSFLMCGAMWYSLTEMQDMSALHTTGDGQQHHFATGGNVQSSAGRSAAGPSHTTSVMMLGSRTSYVYTNTMLGGHVVIAGSVNLQETAEDCAEACSKAVDGGPKDKRYCNVWMWCGDQARCNSSHLQCVLKHQAIPASRRPESQGPHVMWTSGTLDVDLDADPGRDRHKWKHPPGSRKFHVVTSAQGPGSLWMTRVQYYWYKKVKRQCEAQGACDMGGWTRLLHSGEADGVERELPTVVVKPLPLGVIGNNTRYLALNRPFAFQQWCDTVKIPERFVFISEPDQILLRPLPNFMKDDRPAAFPFVYVEPHNEVFTGLLHKFLGPISALQAEQLPPSGASPTFMRVEDLRRLVPHWGRLALATFNDTTAYREWGKVSEMYAFSMAAWQAGLRDWDLYLHMVAHPPYDCSWEVDHGKPFYILHYTYSMDYDDRGQVATGQQGAWRFDKRQYGSSPPYRLLGSPPRPVQNELVRYLMNAINEATAAIPCWDVYAKQGWPPPECKEDTTKSIAAARRMAAENVPYIGT